MQIASFDTVLELLKDLDPWLKSLGIKPKNDRWHEALKTVARAREQRLRIERGDKRQLVPNYIPGLFDATEVHEIFRAFGTDNSPALKDKVTRALSGPIAPLSEQPNNSTARNAMFELSLAADWKNGGARVELGEPDILLYLAQTRFHVECKRPFYDHSVRANIMDAASQLRKELEKPGSENDYGIVAISLSRIFTKGELVCFAPAGEGKRIIRDALEEMLNESGKAWGLGQFRELYDRIVAVVFHLASPWDINGERLIHLSTADFRSTGKNAKGWEVLSNNLPSFY
jgi:hypothetical protein